ncbi:EI24 domain-containing protein [Parathermosynechococcus lividus]
MLGRIWSVSQRFQRGFFAFGRGLRFIARHRLWAYLLLPAIVSFLLGTALIISAFVAVQTLGEQWVVVPLGPWQWLYDAVVDVVAVAIALFLALIGYQTLIPLVVIPFLGPLLNRVEKITTGHTIEVGWRRDLFNTIVGGWFALRDALVQLVCLLLSFLCGPLQPIVMVLVNSYFFGRGSFDYPLEKHSRTLKERQVLTRAYTPEIYGLGLAQCLGLLVPLAGMVLVPAVGVVAAALLIQERDPNTALSVSPALPQR